MGSRVYRFVRLGYGSIAVDYVGDPLRPAVGAVGGAVGEADIAVGVAQQGIREIVFGREGSVFLYAVGADAENLNVPCFVILDSITESTRFRRSPRGSGHGIEPENHGLSRVIAELHFLTRMCRNGKTGCLVSNL